MKYFKRLGLYKASNVTFNPKTLSAHSYDWWQFVKQIDGKVIFNNYRYSQSTSKHQRKVAQVLQELGIVYETVKTVKSLANLETLEQVYAAHAENIEKQKVVAELTRLERNRRARERRAEKKAKEVQNASTN